MKPSKLEPSLFMVIDITKVEETRIRFIATNERAVLLGKLYQAEHPGRKCIAPQLQGRGFSQLDKLALQYLFWNTFNKTPNENYEQLLADCLTESKNLQVNQTEIAGLQASLSLFSNTLSSNDKPSKDKPEKAPKSENSAPKATSTCGVVWDIAEKLFVKNNNVIPERKAVIDACVEEGLHPATASTQFAKWKKTKEPK